MTTMSDTKQQQVARIGRVLAAARVDIAEQRAAAAQAAAAQPLDIQSPVPLMGFPPFGEGNGGLKVKGVLDPATGRPIVSTPPQQRHHGEWRMPTPGELAGIFNSAVKAGAATPTATPVVSGVTFGPETVDRRHGGKRRRFLGR
jgi:hypothetical protein